ncbi:DUF2239 family protein [Microvirga sp. ACRRW]|uniref:DUF2239 family protein n=1 Tax=Microvirga sp. ACRRW TaxID=2918205 RepID=UPI001EF4735D|nr:DUF2239 family protein [Microvirga sp. ACRRW]MCG7392970.1 DUF2239 family protein [Microvirga sp. ACRRW]
MNNDKPQHYTAFAGSRRIASGALADVALKTKEVMETGELEPILILDDENSRVVDVDFRGSAEDVVQRLKAQHPQAEAENQPRGRGRPKLGVVAREVTLLPRHWDWLNAQPGGASVALRKLVEDARRANEAKDNRREGQESLYRFMSIMAGNLPGFEEASRCLFAGKRAEFMALIQPWPNDLRNHAETLALCAFEETDGRSG